MRGPDTLEGGYRMLRQLLARPGPTPTAALVYNDLTAIGALRALRDAGVAVPHGMAVIGTDGIELGRYTNPALTTIDHPRAELGRRAVEAVCAQIDGQPAPETERVLPVRLIVRESCGGAAPTHETSYVRGDQCSSVDRSFGLSLALSLGLLATACASAGAPGPGQRRRRRSSRMRAGRAQHDELELHGHR